MVKLRVLAVVAALVAGGCSTLIGLRDDYHLGDAGPDATTPPEGGDDGPGEAARDGTAEVGSDGSHDGGAGADATPDADAAADADSAPGDAAPEVSAYDGPPSCEGTDGGCGPTGLASCCESAFVEGGTFLHQSIALPPETNTLEQVEAGVSDFRLDKYLVTVGRFRKFVEAMDAGWYPANGEGKHAYLDGGGVTSTITGEPEPGWLPQYDNIELPTSGYTGPSDRLPESNAEWSSYLTAGDCTAPVAMWSSTPSAFENNPINCVSWEGAYAFCIWDGGFLPTDAELNYTQLGGSQQRLYPWSVPPGDAGIDPGVASYGPSEGGCYTPSGTVDDPCTQYDHTVPGSRPGGNGRWGQSDLVGNIPEYTLDCFGDPLPSCSNCGKIGLCSTDHAVRSALDSAPASWLMGAVRQQEQYYDLPLTGFRCARAP